MSRSGIPTKYGGINFRSRLEATWARFFDLCEWRWEYEPYDCDGYIPDFILLGDLKHVIVDVKPISLLSEYVDRARQLDGVVCCHSELLVLGTGLVRSSIIDGSAIGILGEANGPSGERDYATASLMTCRECGTRSFFHDDLSWASRMCGHYDGNRLIGAFDEAEDLWAEAKNGAQWKAVKPARFIDCGTSEKVICNA